MDERYIAHRYYSTRLAAIVAATMMALWVNYEYWFNDILRWDLFIILMSMALVKIGAMIYYRITG